MAQTRKEQPRREETDEEAVNDQIQFSYEQSGELTDFPKEEKEMRTQEP